MKGAGIVWDEKSLDTYVAAPQKAVPGNIMPFAGIETTKSGPISSLILKL